MLTLSDVDGATAGDQDLDGAIPATPVGTGTGFVK